MTLLFSKFEQILSHGKSRKDDVFEKSARRSDSLTAEYLDNEPVHAQLPLDVHFPYIRSSPTGHHQVDSCCVPTNCLDLPGTKTTTRNMATRASPEINLSGRAE
ncbi:MAG: hypothetical protein ABL878_06190 [Burkholderiales bacterium]